MITALHDQKCCIGLNSLIFMRHCPLLKCSLLQFRSVRLSGSVMSGLMLLLQRRRRRQKCHHQSSTPPITKLRYTTAKTFDEERRGVVAWPRQQAGSPPPGHDDDEGPDGGEAVWQSQDRRPGRRCGDCDCARCRSRTPVDGVGGTASVAYVNTEQPSY